MALQAKASHSWDRRPAVSGGEYRLLEERGSGKLRRPSSRHG